MNAKKIAPTKSEPAEQPVQFAKEYSERGPGQLTKMELEYIKLFNDGLATFTEIATHFKFYKKDGAPNRNRAASMWNTIQRKDVKFLSGKERKLLRERRNQFSTRAEVDAYFKSGTRIKKIEQDLYQGGYRFFSKPDGLDQTKHEPVVERQDASLTEERAAAEAVTKPAPVEKKVSEPQQKRKVTSKLPAKLVEDDNDPTVVGILERSPFKNFTTLKTYLSQMTVWLSDGKAPVKEWEAEHIHKYLVGRVDDAARANLGYIAIRFKKWTAINPEPEFLDAIAKSGLYVDDTVEEMPQPTRIKEAVRRSDIIRGPYVKDANTL